MMIQASQQSACQYLFGKEANEIYSPSLISEEFVNQSLNALMEVNVAFLSRKENDGFSLIDPASLTNQCHLYSFFTAKIKREYKKRTKEENLARTEENRFLHLSFLLSHAFLSERSLLCRAIESASEKGEVTVPRDQKLFDLFIKDSLKEHQGILIRTARQSLNEVFERHIKGIFAAAQDRSLLHRELSRLSLEDLQLQSEHGKISFYTLPKVAGMAYLVHEVFSFVIKAKVITATGTGILYYQSTRFLNMDDPVVIFEAMSSDELSMDHFREIAERCPSYFERKPSSKRRHPEQERCLFCNPEGIDISPYRERFSNGIHSRNLLRP
jgi:hypothetical protein